MRLNLIRHAKSDYFFHINILKLKTSFKLQNNPVNSQRLFCSKKWYTMPVIFMHYFLFFLGRIYKIIGRIIVDLNAYLETSYRIIM